MLPFPQSKLKGTLSAFFQRYISITREINSNFLHVLIAKNGLLKSITIAEENGTRRVIVVCNN